MANISTFGFPGGITNAQSTSDQYRLNGEMSPDAALEQQSLNRRQQIANMLLQQGLAGASTNHGQQVGRFYVKGSPWQGIADLAKVAVGAYGTHQTDQDRQSLAQAVEERGKQDIGRYLTETQGKAIPERTLPQGTPDQVIPVQGPPNITQPNVMDTGTSQGIQEQPAQITIPGTPPTQGPVNPAGFQAPDPMIARQAIVEGLANQNPRVREAIQFIEAQKAAQAEKETQRAFLTQEKQADRDVRLQGQSAQLDNMMMLGLITKEQKEAALKQQAETAKQHDSTLEAIASMNLQGKQEAAQQGKTPPGYRQNADGNLEAIPGGPADTKLQGAFNADTAMLQNSNAGFDRLATTANEILNHPGLNGITGIRGKVPDVPGTDAANARALLNTLKSQVGFGVLQEMRNNSKTGGALGAVSDAEGKRLENNLAALDTTQGIEQFKKQLQEIVNYTDQAKSRLRDTFNMKHKSGEPVPMSPSTGKGPQPGTVDGGYRFKGGDPAKADSWERVQ